MASSKEMQARAKARKVAQAAAAKAQQAPVQVPSASYVPKEYAVLHNGILAWVKTKFMKSSTFKKGYKNFSAAYGTDNIDIDLTRLFVALAAQQASTHIQMLSMGNIFDAPAEPKVVTLKDVADYIDENISEFGLNEMVQSYTSYKCYEDWNAVYQVAVMLFNVDKQRFGMLVHLLYDGFSA